MNNDAPVVQLGETAALKAAQCQFESGQAHRFALVADGEASGFQTRDWVFESPPGCQAPQPDRRGAGLQTRRARFDSAAALQVLHTEEWTSC